MYKLKNPYIVFVILIALSMIFTDITPVSAVDSPEDVDAGFSVMPDTTREIAVPAGLIYVDGKSEFRWDVLKAVELVLEDYNAKFKVMWNRNTLYVFAEVADSSRNAEDKIDIFINENNGKTEASEEDDRVCTLFRDGRAAENVTCRVTENDGGYLIEAAVTLRKNMIFGDRMGFNICFTDADTGIVLPWSDPFSAHSYTTSGHGTAVFEKEVKAVYTLYGTPEIDGEMDSVWNDAIEFITNTWVQGITGSTAKVKTLWDERKLYIYAHVTDKALSTASANVWEQDSIEVYIDQNNGKTAEYEADDAQYRISCENRKSYGTGASKDNIVSAVKVIEGGYIVEAAITLDAVSPVEGMYIGFDIQVNNDENGDRKRNSIVTWNDGSGFSYQNTSRFGVLKFVKDEDLVFTDIFDVSWAQDQIEFLASKGILKAVSGKNFEPAKEITRADFLYFLVNTLGLTAETDSNFSDIDKNAYYYEAIAIAKKLGITKGVGEGLYKPSEGITRQDMTTLILRAMDVTGREYDGSDISVIQGFADFSLIADYAVDSMAVLVEKGFIQGSKNRLNPLHNLTRAEAAVLLYRIYSE